VWSSASCAGGTARKERRGGGGGVKSQRCLRLASTIPHFTRCVTMADTGAAAGGAGGGKNWVRVRRPESASIAEIPVFHYLRRNDS